MIDHGDVRGQQSRKQPGDDVGVLHEQHRPRQQAVHQESAEQHCRRIRAGNAEAEQRDQRRARDGVVRGFGRGNAFRRAVAELLLVARPAPRLVVREERRHRPAAARHHPFECPDDRPNQLGQRNALPHRRAGKPDARPLFDRLPARFAGLREQLTDGEQPDHHQDRRDARQQVRAVEREPGEPCHRVGADRRDHQAKNAGHQPFHQRLARERGDHAQPQHAKREVRLRRERERHGRQPLGEQHQHAETEEAADEPE